MADVLDKKCDTVVTCGRLSSNHCRTTAVAAKQLGLECYLIQRSPEQARTALNDLLNVFHMLLISYRLASS